MNDLAASVQQQPETSVTKFIYSMSAFVAGSALAIIIVAMVQDTTLLQLAAENKVAFTVKDRLVPPLIVRMAAGFLFTTTATLLGTVIKEVLNPRPKEDFAWIKWLAIAAVPVLALVAAYVFATAYIN